MTAPAIRPNTKTLEVRGNPLTLTAMADAERIGWIELQVLAARETMAAVDLARKGQEDDLLRICKLLLTADYALVRRATGWDLDTVASYTLEERKAIIAAQDELNQMAQFAPLFAPYASRSALEDLTGQ